MVIKIGQNESLTNIEVLKKLFQKSADVTFQKYKFQKQTVHLITCDAMYDTYLFNKLVIERIGFFCNNLVGSLEKRILVDLHLPILKKVNTEQEAIKIVYRGFVLIYFEEEKLLYSCNIALKPNRKIKETNLEATILGPRDNFIEDIDINIALIRKRLPTNSLAVENLEIGKRSQTKVAILYLDDIANEQTLRQIKKSLKNVDTDIIVSGDLLLEHVFKKVGLFPKSQYTGKADFALQALVRGRFLILVDGVSYALILPVNFFLLVKSSEDIEYLPLYTSIVRLLRIVGISLGTFLPGFWIALTEFHQEQLPFQLIATVVQSRSGIPLPAVFEMLIMLFIFDLLKESGLRLPSSLGSILGVIGGLIIGNASIKAGLTSQSMVLIIAVSTVSTFMLVNQALTTSVSIVRYIFVIASGFLGLFGFFMTLFFLVIYLSNIRVFGVSYMNLFGDLSWKTVMSSVFRLPAKSYKTRPEMLKTKDETRS